MPCDLVLGDVFGFAPFERVGGGGGDTTLIHDPVHSGGRGFSPPCTSPCTLRCFLNSIVVGQGLIILHKAGLVRAAPIVSILSSSSCHPFLVTMASFGLQCLFVGVFFMDFVHALDVSWIPADPDGNLPLSTNYRDSLRKLCHKFDRGDFLSHLPHQKKVLAFLSEGRPLLLCGTRQP